MSDRESLFSFTQQERLLRLCDRADRLYRNNSAADWALEAGSILRDLARLAGGNADDECDWCSHEKSIHMHGPNRPGRCRANDCSCQKFLDPPEMVA